MSEPVFIEVVTDDQPGVVSSAKAYGQGENAVATLVKGNPVSIKVATSDGAKIGLRFHDDGSVTLSTYDNTFRMAVPTNLRLETNRDWRS